MTLEITNHEALNLLHALALAYKSARRDDVADEMGRMYDRLHEAIMQEGAEHDER